MWIVCRQFEIPNYFDYLKLFVKIYHTIVFEMHPWPWTVTVKVIYIVIEYSEHEIPFIPRVLFVYRFKHHESSPDVEIQGRSLSPRFRGKSTQWKMTARNLRIFHISNHSPVAVSHPDCDWPQTTNTAHLIQWNSFRRSRGKCDCAIYVFHIVNFIGLWSPSCKFIALSLRIINIG